jgi:integrase
VHEVAVAFLFALETAMRAGEILSLTPDQVRGRVAHLDKTKNGDKREVPLSTRAVELFTMLCKYNENGFTINSKQLDGLFRKYRDKAGIEGLRFHDTRRTATVKLAAVFDVMTLAKITGHRDVRTLLNVYYKVDSESLADKLG